MVLTYLDTVMWADGREINYILSVFPILKWASDLNV